MNLQTLRDILSGALAGGRFDLAGTALGPAADPVPARLASLFSPPRLQLSGAQVDVTGAQPIVRGTLSGAPRSPYQFLAGMSVVAMFSLDEGGTPQLQLTFTPTNPDFGLPDALPGLRNSALSAFTWAGTRFRVSTQAPAALPASFPSAYGYPPNSAAVQAGMSVDATVTYAGNDAGMIWLVGATPVAISGPLECSGSAARFDLGSALIGTRSLDRFALPLALHLVGVMLEVATEASPAGEVLPVAFVALTGALDVPAGGPALSIPFNIEFVSETNQIAVVARPAQASAVAMSELAVLLGVDSLASQQPSGDTFPSLSGLVLRSLALTVDTAGRRLLLASAEVAFTPPGGRWAPFGPSVLAFQELSITFRVIGPLSSPSFATSIATQVSLSDGVLDAEVDLPGLDFCCELTDGSPPIDLTTLLASATGGAFGDRFKALCTSLKVLGNPSQSYYRLQATIGAGHTWGFEAAGARFALDSVGFDLTVHTGAEGSTTGQVVAELVVANTPVQLSADYQGAGAGWTFHGGTEGPVALSLTDLVSDALQLFGLSLPATAPNVEITGLRMMLATGAMDFGFSCEGTVVILGTTVGLDIDLGRTHDDPAQPSAITTTFAGHLTIGGQTFTADFTSATAGRAVKFAWTDADAPLDLAAIAAFFHVDLPALPDGLELGLTAAELFYDFDAGTVVVSARSVSGQVVFASLETPATALAPARRVHVLAVDVALGLELADLPLVGAGLPAGAHLGVPSLQIVYSSSVLVATELAQLNALITGALGDAPLVPTALDAGFTFAARLELGGATQAVVVPVGAARPGNLPAAGGTGAIAAPTTAAPTTAAPASPDGVTWARVQKSFGPLQLGRIGLQYRGGELRFLLDASLEAAGLTLALDGLAVGFMLAEVRTGTLAPRFALHGLGLDYRSGPVEISGAFLRQTATVGTTAIDVYDGAAILATEALTLEAMGSYASIGGHPSLFVYAVLDYPIGGPAFFFVTGLAAGFGYNRALRLPSLDQLPRFPLIEAAAGSSGSPDSSGGPGGMMAMLQRLEQDGVIPPAVGEAFLAVGIRFTSFKLIDSFLLLTAALGGQFELDLLGLSTLIVPTPEAGRSVTPLAEVQMALRGSFQPEQGFLGIAAQLTSASYILSRDCHLTGGFAFYSWFSGSHAGDFVQTLGGYHPQFQRPDWYPVVPRLGVNWQVDSHLSIKGEAYFALTSSLLMAGGALQVTWEAGDLRAWFLLAADFLVSWKPFHYDARIAVDMGVSYTFHLFGSHTISADLGAELHVWGPDFAGTAQVHLWIVSFDVSFGSSAPSLPPPLPWDGGDQAFQESFLPRDALCSVTIAGGLLRSVVARTGEIEQTIWIVNAKDLCLVTNSVVPSKRAFLDGAELSHDGTTRFGVAPMALASDSFETSHRIRIYRDGDEAPDLLQAKPVRKRVPAALWGEQRQPGLHDDAFIEAALTGFTLTPAGGPVPGETAPIPRSALQFSTEEVENAYAWTAPGGGFKPARLDDDARREALATSLGDSGTAEARASLLRALGFEPTAVTLRPDSAALFIIPPQIAA